MLRFLDAGESHGNSLVAILEGFPSNIDIDIEKINLQLRRRQMGYDRRDWMKIETSIRVAIGAICMELFRNFNVKITSKVINVGEIYDNSSINMSNLENLSIEESSSVRFFAAESGARMIKEIDNTLKLGETINKYSYDFYIERITGR